MLSLTDEVEVRQASELKDLEGWWPDWEALWKVAEHSTPFQSPAWLVPWWRHLGQGKLQCFSFWRNGELRGLAPFYIYTRPMDGTRQLLLLGTGNSDYLDILVRPDDESAVLKQLSACLEGSQDQWDIAEFLQLRSTSPLLRLTFPNASVSFSEEITLQEPCPALELPATPQDDWSFFNRSCFTRLDYYWRRSNRAGSMQVEGVDVSSVDEALDALVCFEETRWSQKGLTSVLSEPSIQRFHRVACYHMCAARTLRFYVIRLNNLIVAAFYGFHHRDRVYYYLGGFDPRFSSLSPGKLILAHAIERAVRERAAVFDFLRGQEAYKYEWGAQDTAVFRRAFWARKKEVGYEHSSSHYQTRCL